MRSSGVCCGRLKCTNIFTQISRADCLRCISSRSSPVVVLWSPYPAAHKTAYIKTGPCALVILILGFGLQPSMGFCKLCLVPNRTYKFHSVIGDGGHRQPVDLWQSVEFIYNATQRMVLYWRYCLGNIQNTSSLLHVLNCFRLNYTLETRSIG